MKKTLIDLILLLCFTLSLKGINIETITSVTLNKTIEFDRFIGTIKKYENRLFVSSWNRVNEYMILEDGSLEHFYSIETGLNSSLSIVDQDRLYTFYRLNQRNYMLIFDLNTQPMTHLHRIEIPIIAFPLLPPQIMGDIIHFSDMRSKTLRFNKRTLEYEPPYEGFYSFFVNGSMFLIPYFGASPSGGQDIYVRFYDYSLADAQNPYGLVVLDYFLNIYELRFVNTMKIIDDILYIMGYGYVCILDISDLENISSLFTYVHNDPFIQTPSYYDSLFYEDFLILSHEDGLQIFDITEEDNPLIVKEISFGFGSFQYESMYIHNDLLYVNEGSNLGIYDLKNNFEIFDRYGFNGQEMKFNGDYTIGIENSRFSDEIAVFSVLDENPEKIIIKTGFEPGEYSISMFEMVDDNLYVLSRLNRSLAFFDVYDLGNTERVFRGQLPFTSSTMKIIGDFIYIRESSYLDRHHIYQYVDNDLRYICFINGVIGSVVGYEPDGYFIVSTPLQTEFRDMKNPLNVLHTRPLIQGNISEMNHIAENTIGVYHGNNLLSFYTYDDDFSNFNRKYQTNQSDNPAINFHNGFMGRSGLFSSLSRLYQIYDGVPRQIWELDEHIVVTGMFVFPEKNKLIIRKWTGVYVYDIEYTVSDSDPVMPLLKTELLSNYPNPFNPETTIEFIIRNSEFGVRSYAPPMMNINNQSYLKYPDRDYGFVERGGEGGERVSIDIYNIRGQKVRSLLDGLFESGTHTVVWDGRDDSGRELGSGVYLYRMVAGEETSVRKMVLLK